MVHGILAKCFTGLVGAFIFLSSLSAQDAPPKTIKLPNGTPIHLYLKDDLDSKTSREGDPIRFQVREDVEVGNVVVIPAGSLAQGHVTAVSHKGMAGHSGRLGFSVDYIAAPDGSKVPVVSTPSITGGSNGMVTAAATVEYGPAALLMQGWNADIRKGTMLNAYVNGNFEIGMANLTVHPTYTSTSSTDSPGKGAQTPPPLPRRPNPPASTPPAIVLLDPSVSKSGDTIDISTSAITIRGVVMDAAGLPTVTINGATADLVPNGPQSASFTSELVQLQPGDNSFEVVATNAANLQTKITFIARYTAQAHQASPVSSHPSANKPLSKSEIITLLENDVPSARVAYIVNERGIVFVPTQEDIKDIRTAGGGDGLVNALLNAKPHSQ